MIKILAIVPFAMITLLGLYFKNSKIKILFNVIGGGLLIIQIICFFIYFSK